jgi:opacity protein-like surface antigen
VSPRLAKYLNSKQQETGECEVWAENWTSFKVFRRLQTQWRVGFAGATGLDYEAAESVARGIGVRWSARRIDELRVMERAALTLLRQE